MGLDTKMPIMDSKKVVLKSLEEITLLQKSAQLVSRTLGILAKEIKPGINTLYLDKIAEEFIRDNKGVPGFLGMYDFPNTLCVSTNHEVVHGIPNKKPLEDGDIVSIDCGVLMNDFYGDHAYTFEVGQVSDEIKKLLKTAKESLYMGIDNFRIGNRVGEISYSIQKHMQRSNRYHQVGCIHNALMTETLCDDFINLCFDIYKSKDKFSLISDKWEHHKEIELFDY